jgi:site-specific DNA-methyltransferase (adenine-specific)
MIYWGKWLRRWNIWSLCKDDNFVEEQLPLIRGDCLEVMARMDSQSVDMILCDLPYGTTACKWDVIIPFKPLWVQYNRILSPLGNVVLFGTEPFSSMLRMSNLNMYKYDWVWEKNFSTNFLHAKHQPLRKHELVSVFYNTYKKYNCLKSGGHVPTQSAKGCSNGVLWHGTNRRNYSGGSTERFPTSILKFDAEDPKHRLHPTQKPVALCEYLIKTYSNEGDVVLDNCIGSGTTAIACIRTNRKFIGIEKEEKYFKIANEEIKKEMLKK